MQSLDWISVEDRSPDDDGEYQCYTYLDCEYENVHSQQIIVFIKDSGGWQTDVNWATKVTHWQPLPEPPVKE